MMTLFRTAPNVGICYNTAGSYSCRSCSLPGSQHFSDSGTIYSQSSWPSNGDYPRSMDTHWHIKYQDIRKSLSFIPVKLNIQSIRWETSPTLYT